MGEQYDDVPVVVVKTQVFILIVILIILNRNKSKIAVFLNFTKTSDETIKMNAMVSRNIF